MTERPILFNNDMVRAIVEGKKTQTRRPIKPQPGPFIGPTKTPRTWLMDTCAFQGYSEKVLAPCAVGDILWVRETWCLSDAESAAESAAISYRADGPVGDCVWHDVPREHRDRVLSMHEERWRPSIHMPRWACRIFLRVTDVQAVRLDDMSIGEMRAEGFETSDEMTAAWNGIYAKDGFGWDANPWVWAISFEPCTDQGTADV